MCMRLLRRLVVVVATTLALLVSAAAPASAGGFATGAMTIVHGWFELTGSSVGSCTQPAATLDLALVGSTVTVNDFDAQVLFTQAIYGFWADIRDSTVNGDNTGSRTGSTVHGFHLGFTFALYDLTTTCTKGSLLCEGDAGFWVSGTAVAGTTTTPGSFSLAFSGVADTVDFAPSCSSSPFVSWTDPWCHCPGATRPYGWSGFL